MKSQNDYLLSSNKELLCITTDSISGIKTAITHLQTKEVLLFCATLNENVGSLASFVKKSNDYYSELEKIYLQQQAFHTSHDQSAITKSSVIYTSMLLDIMIDCRTYITATKHLCEKLFSIRKTIEILCKENRHNKESCDACLKGVSCINPVANERFKKLIASSGFRLQIVLHYSSWVALNEICKNTEELIASWNLG